MALCPLNTAGLANLDGGLFAAVVDQAIANAVRDMQDRHTVLGPRTVTIELTFTPGKVDIHTKELEQVLVNYALKEKQPARKSGPVNCGVQKNGALRFNDLAPDNPDQRTFDLGSDERERPRE